MKLQFTALLIAATLSAAIAAPTYAATAPAKPVAAASAMTAKPAAKVAKAATPDPKRFATEAAAQATCGAGDSVVWANTHSKIFHLKGTATYGKGKNGTYMCQADATTEKFKPTKKPEKQVS